MKLLSIFQLLGELEAGVAKLYGEFSDRLKDDPEASRLFATLSAEEVEHEKTVDYELRMIKSKPGFFNEVEADTGAIEALIRLTKEELKGRQTLEEMVRLAARIESDVAEQYHVGLMEEANPWFGSLVKKMSKESHMHLQRVLKFAEARGIDGPAK